METKVFNKKNDQSKHGKKLDCFEIKLDNG